MPSTTRLYDAYARADTAPGSLGTAPTGQAWTLAGPGAATAKITSQRYVSGTPGTSQNTYAYATFAAGTTIKQMRCVAVWNGATNPQVLAMVSSRFPEVAFTTDLIHIIFWPAFLQVQKFVATTVTTLDTIPLALTADGATEHEFIWWLDGSELTVIYPGGRRTYTDSDFPLIAGRTAYFQIADTATSTDRGSFETVEASIVAIPARQRFASAPPNRITLYGEGWTNPQPVNVSRLAVTWNVEQPGRLSCFVPAKELHRLGYDNVIGLWVYYQHPTQGVWAGIVEDEPGEIDSGLVEISAVDMRGLLMGRRSPILYRQDTAHAGALMRRALSDVMTTDPILFTEILCDEVGQPVETENRGDDLYDLAAELANQSGQEFDVVVSDDRAITLLWQEELGADKTGTVLIREGAEITGGRVDRSLTTITNDIAGVANDESYERSSYYETSDAASIAAYGRRQSPVRRYEGVVTESTVSSKVKADLRRESQGVYLPTVTIPALHPVCQEIRHGDRIREWSTVKNREFVSRVMSRTVRDGVILELQCEAVAERLPPRARSFTPDMLSGLVAWFDADDASTITILDGGVWEWRDKSNAGNDASASGGFGVSGLPGLLRAGLLNGRNVVFFDTDGGMDTSAFSLAHTSAVTVYMVTRPVGDNFPCLRFGAVGSVAGSWDIGTDATNHARARCYGNVGTASFESTATLGATDFHQITAVLDMSLATNEASLWLDGSASGGRASNSNNTGAYHASQSLDLNPSAGDMATDFAELLVFDRAHDATKRAAMESYFAAKWGSL